jgi:hypothetical protein
MAQPVSVMSSCENRQLLAGRDADHLLHQVDAGDQLGHRMLHLQARVHLEEVEVLVLPSTMNSTVPALVVAHRLGQREACSPIALRVSGSRKGDGASSMTFWLRRWIEHSRSPR